MPEDVVNVAALIGDGISEKALLRAAGNAMSVNVLVALLPPLLRNAGFEVYCLFRLGLSLRILIR